MPRPDEEIKAIDTQLCLSLVNNNTALATDMFNMLTDNLPNELQSIHDTFNKNDYKALLELVHKFHGACCYTGIPRIKQVAKEFEKAIKLNQTEIFQESLNLLTEEVTVIMDWKKENDISTLLNQNL